MRMRLLTKKLPKIMGSVFGKPLVNLKIELLTRNCVKLVMVNLSHHLRKFDPYFGDGHRQGKCCVDTCIHQPNILTVEFFYTNHS